MPADIVVMMTLPIKYVVSEGVHQATVRDSTEFTVEAYDEEGERITKPGMLGIFVAIRGVSKVRPHIIDNGDGTVTIRWKPPQSGHYSIAVSNFGIPIPDSPFSCETTTPEPWPLNCVAQGEALVSGVARVTNSFQLAFKDKTGTTTHAVELDMFVEPVQPGSPRSRVRTPASVTDGMASSIQPTRAKSPPIAGADPQQPEPVSVGGGGAPKSKSNKKIALNVRDVTATVQAALNVLDATAGTLNLPTIDEDLEWEDGPGGMTKNETRFRQLRIRVGENPLVVRAEFDLASEQIGLLLPGSMATVLEERISPGNVRACVALDYLTKEEGDALRVESAAPTVQRAAPPTLQRGSTFRSNGRSSSRGKLTLPPAPAGATRGNGPTSNRNNGATSNRNNGATSNRNNGLSSNRSNRSGGQSSFRANTGWVTLVKNGKKLVSSRLRLEPNRRYQYSEQWTRRMHTDKMAISEKKEDDLRQTAAAKSAAKLAKMADLRSHFQLELSSAQRAADPAAFAFGGVHPGTLHAHGKLFEWHKVSYSIGIAGQYLMHLRLRKQAASLPGSPFLLTIRPGAAFAPSTTLPNEIHGEVGGKCSMVVVTGDRMGNRCEVGGAPILCDCFDERVEAECEDLKDGSYRITWHCKTTGIFTVTIKIDDVHMQQSPAQMVLVSTVPSLANCILHGAGLTTAVKGETANFRIRFMDEHGNLTIQTPAFRAAFQPGMTLVALGMKDMGGAKEEIDGQWLDEIEGGYAEYQISFVPAKTGGYSLFVFDESTGPRVSISKETPYVLNVTEVAAEDMVALSAEQVATSHQAKELTGIVSGDYQVNNLVFQETQGLWGDCTIDGFASAATTLLPRFWTKAAVAGSEGTNAFKQLWGREERVWAHPPPEALDDLAKFLSTQERQSACIICAPFRPQADWFYHFTKLSDNSKKYAAGMLKPVADDVTGRLASWPIMVFHVPAPALEAVPSSGTSHTPLVVPLSSKCKLTRIEPPEGQPLVENSTLTVLLALCDNKGSPLMSSAGVRVEASCRGLGMSSGAKVQDNKDGTQTISATVGPPGLVKLLVRVDKAPVAELSPQLLTVVKKPKQPLFKEAKEAATQQKTGEASTSSATASNDPQGKDPGGKDPGGKESPSRKLVVKDVPWIASPALLAMAEPVIAEADHLKAQAGSVHDSFEMRLGAAILSRLGSAGKLQDIIRDWDKNGDGDISKIEFRQCVTGRDTKSLGMMAQNKDIDAFFATMDSDGGGSLQLTELKPALKKLQEQSQNADATAAKMRQNAEALLQKAVEIKQLAAETKAVEDEEAKLRDMQEGQSAESKLGAVILKRNMNLGELITKWDKVRAMPLEAATNRTRLLASAWSHGRTHVHGCCLS